MGRVSLEGSSVLPWATKELILICLFAAFITANFFIFSRRLYRLERRRARDPEEGGHDGKLQEKSHDIQTADSKKALFDEEAFQSIIASHSGNNFILGSFFHDLDATVTRRELLQTFVKFLHLNGSETPTKGTQKNNRAAAAVLDDSATVSSDIRAKVADHYPQLDGRPDFPVVRLQTRRRTGPENYEMDQSSGWNLPACFACSRQNSTAKFATKCFAHGCGRHRCGECLFQVHKTMNSLGGFARGYCPCGQHFLDNGTDLLPSQQAARFDTIFRDVSPSVPKCMFLRISTLQLTTTLGSR